MIVGVMRIFSSLPYTVALIRSCMHKRTYDFFNFFSNTKTMQAGREASMISDG
jgi:hypothetical protein